MKRSTSAATWASPHKQGLEDLPSEPSVAFVKFATACCNRCRNFANDKDANAINGLSLALCSEVGALSQILSGRELPNRDTRRVKAVVGAEAEIGERQESALVLKVVDA